MSKGKMLVQAAHASVTGAIRDQANYESVSMWRADGMAKVVLKVDSEEQLKALIKLALFNKLNAGFITDAGKTEFKGVATVTSGWIGPHEDCQIDLITDKLKLL